MNYVAGRPPARRRRRRAAGVVAAAGRRAAKRQREEERQEADRRREEEEHPELERYLNDLIWSLQRDADRLREIEGDVWKQWKASNPGLLIRLREACQGFLDLLAMHAHEHTDPRRCGPGQLGPLDPPGGGDAFPRHPGVSP
jgi:hypothetical protein